MEEFYLLKQEQAGEAREGLGKRRFDGQEEEFVESKRKRWGPGGLGGEWLKPG